jgi:hypothetical protein
MVLLDATADIDGISKVVPWRKHADTPPERYERLEIHHVPSVADGTLRRWLGKRANLQDYIAHVRELILRYVATGEKALVVCLKEVIAAEGVAEWSEHMQPFLNRTAPDPSDALDAEATEFTEGLAWSLEGRQVVFTWFGGYGVGSNVWREADVVIVCDDFYLPHRVIKAMLQGLQGRKATEGDLARTGATWSEDLEHLEDGHIVRWMKQMALRGKARNIDENGVCGHQRLVITGEVLRLLGHKPEVFPGAKIHIEDTEASSQLERLIGLLLRAKEDEVSTTTIGQFFDTDWSDLSSNLRKHKDWQNLLDKIGWSYHTNRGRKPGYFKRVSSPKSLIVVDEFDF